MEEKKDENEISELEIIEFRRCFKRTQLDLDNYMFYGPANPLKPRHPHDTNLSCKFSEDGICYMMKCKCLEYDEDCNEYYDDWFTGLCGDCNKKMENKSEAWRIPDIYGAYKGCICEDCYNIKFVGIDDERQLAICKVIKTIRKKFPIKFVVPDVVLENDDNVADYI